MTPTPSSSSDSPAIRDAKRSAARTGYITILVIIGLGGLWNGLEIVSDLRHGRDITWALFGLFLILVALGGVVSRRRQYLGRQKAADAAGDRGTGSG